MPGIVEGIDTIINKALGLNDKASYRHKSSLLKLSKKPLRLDGHTLVQGIYNRIKGNWNKKESRSHENWRWEVQREMSHDNDSKEVKLERAIVNIPAEVWTDSSNWCNQVPTSSGLTDGTNAGRRAIDLVHRCEDGWHEFIELKITSNTPLYAAMELLQYGVLYILSRENHEKLGYNKNDNPLLWARGIHLQVLAPSAYYEEYGGNVIAWLKELEREISKGIHQFLRDLDSDYEMDFGFKRLFLTPVIDELPKTLKKAMVSQEASEARRA